MRIFAKNPVFRREFLVLARSKKAWTSALLLVGILSFVLFLLWPRTGVFSQVDSNDIFTVFLGTNLALAVLLVPAFTATAITTERENKSFSLLFTTALRPAEILLGKLFSSVGMLFLVLLLAVPVSAICALSGGISFELLFKTYAVIFLASLTYGLLGLAVSAMCSRNFTSVVVSYLAVAFLAGATWLPSVLLRQLTPLQPIWQAIRSLSPFEALFALNRPAEYEVALGGTILATSSFYIYVVGMIVLAAIFFFAFCLFLTRPIRSRKTSIHQQYSDLRTSMKRRLGFPFYLIDPLKRKRPISLLRNPVFVAELRSKVFGKPKFILRALAACIALSLIILILICFNFASIFGPEQVRLVAILFQFGLIILLAPVVSSGTITEERTSGTILLLRMTPLTAWTTIMGKLKAAFIYVLIFLLSSLPVLFALAYLETEAAYWRIAAWIGTLILTAVVFILTGLLASTCARSTAAATAVSYAVALILSVVTLAVLMFGTRITPEVKAGVLTVNPLVAAVQITSDTWFADLPELASRPLWHNHLFVFGGLAVLMLILSVFRMHHILRERI